MQAISPIGCLASWRAGGLAGDSEDRVNTATSDIPSVTSSSCARRGKYPVNLSLLTGGHVTAAGITARRTRMNIQNMAVYIEYSVDQ